MLTKKIAGVVILSLVCGPLLLANGLHLGGLGTRAQTMGGAFVALADDFSAIYWNPAGMANFKKMKFGFNLTGIIPDGSYKLETEPAQHPGPIQPLPGRLLADTKTMDQNAYTGLAAIYVPITDNLVAGLGVHIPSAYRTVWDGEELTGLHLGNDPLEWNTRINVMSFSPAVAYKIHDMVMVGVALNINRQTMNMERWGGSVVTSPPGALFIRRVDLGQLTETFSGWGVGATAGLLVKPADFINIGLSYRTASTMKLEGTSGLSRITFLPGAANVATESQAEREVIHPAKFAGGVAFNLSEGFVMTFDIHWTGWEKLDTIATVYQDQAWQTMLSQYGVDEMTLHWKNVTQLRFGLEYHYGNLAVRSGYFRDSGPAPDRTAKIYLPALDSDVFAFGLGYRVSGVQIDLGAQYFAGISKVVSYKLHIEDPDWATAMPGRYRMNSFVPTLSLSYAF